MTEDERTTVLEFISLDELRAYTIEALEEAAFTLKLSIWATRKYEPNNMMATERDLLSRIQLVLWERHLSDTQKEEANVTN